MTLPVLPLAHGLVQRADLPLPEDFFIITAAVVLAVSFIALAVLWPQPRLEDARWRPLFPRFEAVCGAIGVFLLAVTIPAAFLGPETPLQNFASNFVFVVFWVGLVFASLLLGDVFRAFNPWRAIGRVLRFEGRRPYPERLGYWPAVAALVGFGWLELAPSVSGSARNLGIAASIYTVVTLLAMWRYGTETWAERGEGFGVYFGLVARIAPRPVLGGLPKFEPRAGAVWLVGTLIGITTFDGFSANSIWDDINTELSGFFEDAGFSFQTAETLSMTIGLAAGVLFVVGFYTLGIAGARTVGGPHSAARLRALFIHTLVPIAVVYVLAHYLTLLVFQGQSLKYLASDPFGEGWDLFGTADGAIDFGAISQNTAWYLQVIFVVAGHVAALMLAHDRALTVYDNAKLAVRSQYWMLLIMIGFTTLALWLLKSAGS